MNFPIFHLHREIFHDSEPRPSDETAKEAATLQSLIERQDPMTPLLESIAGEKITVHILAQDVVQQVPSALSSCLKGNSFLRRMVSLEARGYVLLDSLSYIDIEVLPFDARQRLLDGIDPIGHVLSGLWTERSFRRNDTELLEELWATVGHADARASRSTCIHTLAGPSIILAETFRRGVLALSSSSAGVAWQS